MVSWLVCSTPERMVWVRVLAVYIVLCSWARHFTPSVPLSTLVYKWVPANLILGVTLPWTSIPSRGSRNTPSRFMLQKPGISSGLMGHLDCKLTFVLPQFFPPRFPQLRWLKQVSTLKRNVPITRIDTTPLDHLTAMLWCHVKHQLLLKKIRSFYDVKSYRGNTETTTFIDPLYLKKINVYEVRI